MIKGLEGRVKVLPMPVVPLNGSESPVIGGEVEIGLFVLYDQLAFFPGDKPIGDGIIVCPEYYAVVSFAIKRDLRIMITDERFLIVDGVESVVDGCCWRRDHFDGTAQNLAGFEL